MTTDPKSKPLVEQRSSDSIANSDSDEVPTKAEILEDIGEGFHFVMSGGRGQPIDEMHREIAEELTCEELTHNAGISK